MSAWLAAHCGGGDFADYRVELDGSYTIDWSGWASDKPGVRACSVRLEQFIYRTYHLGNGAAISASPTNVYESCESAGGQWSCQGPASNIYHLDSAGNPTRTRTLASNLKGTQWSSALGALGSISREQTLYQWDSDPQTQPTTVTYSIKDVEVDRSIVTPKGSNSNPGGQTVTVAGASNFNHGDRR